MAFMEGNISLSGRLAIGPYRMAIGLCGVGSVGTCGESRELPERPQQDTHGWCSTCVHILYDLRQTIKNAIENKITHEATVCHNQLARFYWNLG